MKTVRLDQIRLDGDTQSRVELSDDVIHEYANLMQQGAEFPPLLVVFDGTSYWLVDGFHRRWAAIKAKLDKFKCEVVEGTREHARWLSYGTNKAHGLPRSSEDKKKAVIAALKHPKGEKKSDTQIAEHVGVSHSTVAKYRASLETTCQIGKSEDRTGRDGRTINTANIGRKPVSRDSIPSPNPQPKPEPPAWTNGTPELQKAVKSGAVSVGLGNEIARTKTEIPERSVFVSLRAVFDEMTPTERQTAATMWNDWMET